MIIIINYIIDDTHFKINVSSLVHPRIVIKSYELKGFWIHRHYEYKIKKLHFIVRDTLTMKCSSSQHVFNYAFKKGDKKNRDQLNLQRPFTKPTLARPVRWSSRPRKFPVPGLNSICWLRRSTQDRSELSRRSTALDASLLPDFLNLINYIPHLYKRMS